MGRELMAIAVGGAVGALARWLLTDVLAPAGDDFPWATLAVNVSGCLLLALLSGLASVRARPLVAVGLGPGLLGGFTTLSAYAEESRALVDSGRPGLAAAYVVITLAACLLAVAGARRISRPLPAAGAGR